MLEVKHDHRCCTLLGHVADMMSEIIGQGLANTIWAFAKLEMREEAVMNAASSRARKTLVEFSATSLANAVLAFAKLAWKDEAFLKAGLSRARETLSEFNTQDLANAVCAFGRGARAAGS